MPIRETSEYIVQQSGKLNNDWTSVPDNEFAADFFNKIGWEKARPSSSQHTTRLGEFCNLGNLQSTFDDVAALTLGCLFDSACSYFYDSTVRSCVSQGHLQSCDIPPTNPSSSACILASLYHSQ